MSSQLYVVPAKPGHSSKVATGMPTNFLAMKNLRRDKKVIYNKYLDSFLRWGGSAISSGCRHCFPVVFQARDTAASGLTQKKPAM